MLSMSSCSLGDDSVPYIVFCLKANRNITHIDLSANKFTPSGAEELISAVNDGVGRQLVHLDLSYIPLGDTGVLAMARMLEANKLPMLSSLTLKEIGASPMAMHKLLRVVQGTKTALKRIDFSGNPIFSVKKKVKTCKNPMSAVAPRLREALASFQDILSKQLSVVKSRKHSKFSVEVVPPRIAGKLMDGNKKKKSVGKNREKKEGESRSKNSRESPLKVESAKGRAGTRNEDDGSRLRTKGVDALLGLISGARSLEFLGLNRVGLDAATCKLIAKRTGSADLNGKIPQTVEGCKREVAESGVQGVEYCSNLAVELYLNNISPDNLQQTITNIKKLRTKAGQ